MREINRVLMISKMTELEFDEFKLGAAVDEYHKLRGIDVRRLEEAHEYHYRCLDETVRGFKEHGVSPGIIKKQNLGRSDFKERWDLIVPIGGDGTFMDVARYVQDDTLFFGIKSSPRSVGGHYYANFNDAAEQIGKVLRGEYSVERRPRIEGVVHNDFTVSDLALNDLYIGDRYIVGYTRLEVHYDGAVHEACGNGIVFSTYHGRTGWYDNIPVPETDGDLVESVRRCLGLNGMRQDVSLLSNRCDFVPGESECIKFKLLMPDGKKKSSLPSYGIVRPGEDCTIVSRVMSNGCASFDGNKTARPRHRMYDMYDGSSVTIRVSDKPLHVVRV